MDKARNTFGSSLRTQMGPAVFLYVAKLIDDRGDPLKSAKVKQLAPFFFQASLLKLLPEVLLNILIGVLSEAGSSENFGLP